MGILLSVIRYLGSLTDDDDDDDEENVSPKNPSEKYSVAKPNIRYSPSSLAQTSVNDKVKSTSSSAVFIEENYTRPKKTRRMKHYNNRHRILLVGEGDFSFSTCLARAFGLAPNMVATSLNSEDFLVKNYENAMPNIVELGLRKCKVMHEIDATVMAKHEFLGGIQFDCIIFNFPFAGFFKNLSSDNKLRRHRRLVSLFLKNAKELLSEEGEIHITHKTNGSHVEWNVVSMASSHGLMLVEAVDFKLHHYPGYNTKYGFGGDENFSCYPSKTYKFGLKRDISN